MDAPENSGNRIGRTIWTVWGYLSGAVARYLRPEVTDEGNQSAHSTSDGLDLKSNADKFNEESKTEEKRYNRIDKSTAEIKCSLPEARVQVASVQWENTDVVKDDRKDVDTTKKQTYRFAKWSSGTDNESDKGGYECKGDARIKKAVSPQRVHVRSGNSESRTAQVLEEIGQIEQKDGNNEECDHEDEKCAVKNEDPDNANVMIQCELYGGDVELDKQTDVTDRGETEDTGSFKHADERLLDEKETQLDPNDQEKRHEKGPESQVQDLLPQLETDDLSKSEMMNITEKYSHEIAEFFKNEVEEILPEQHEESESAQELEETRHTEEKDDDNEECDQNLEDENCEIKNEGQDNADVMVQSEQEMEIVHQNDLSTNEYRGGKRPESQAQDLLPHVEYSTDSFRSKPEKQNIIEGYSDEFSRNEVEEMILETEQDEDTIDSEQDTTKSELLNCIEVSEEISEKNVPKDEMELKITTVLDELFETVKTTKDTPQSDSKQDTIENTPETGTGSLVVAIKTEASFSDRIVCEVSGELEKEPETASASGGFEEITTNPHELQSFAEEYLKQETEPSEALRALEETVVETQIESLGSTESQTHQDIDQESTDLTGETIETKIGSEEGLVEETEPFEIESQSSVITNVAVEPHELLEFTQGECHSSKEILGKMDTLNESLGNSAEPAKIEHVTVDRPDEKPILPKSLSLGEFEEESVDLQGQSERCTEEQEILDTDLAKVALEYVQKITNQALKEMIETEMNLVHETEPSVGLSEDKEYQAPVESMSADAFVLEEESKLLDEAINSKVEMEVETASKQNEQLVSLPECETTKIDECDEQQMVSTGTNHGGSISGDTDSEEHKDDAHVEKETVQIDESQAERLYADTECCKESEIELEETGQAEEKDENREKCEDAGNVDIQFLSEEKQINTTDCEEKQDIGGFRHADEQKETKTVDQEDQESDEPQEPELKADAFVLEDKEMFLGEKVDANIEMEVETAGGEMVQQTEQTVSSAECETAEADGRHEQTQKIISGERVLSSHEDLTEVCKPAMKRGFDQVSEDLPEVKIEGQCDLDLQVLEDSSLDFAVQKSRIAVKNPLVRPPKDPRKLISKTSVEPLLPKPSPCRADGSVPNTGVIGFKLPGIGAGLPVLRKTEFGKKAREGGEAERTLHPQEQSVAVTDDSVKQEPLSAKPKWTPPKHPGMGSPLMMAELKNKLKKPKE